MISIVVTRMDWNVNMVIQLYSYLVVRETLGRDFNVIDLVKLTKCLEQVIKQSTLQLDQSNLILVNILFMGPYLTDFGIVSR